MTTKPTKNIILLNSDYTFLNTVSMKRAFRLIFREKVEVLSYDNTVLCSIDARYKVPMVLRLVSTVSRIYSKRVPYSKKNVFIRDEFVCQYCGKENLLGRDCTVDHVHPQDRNGKSKFENIVTSCQSCNTYKGNSLLSDTGMMFIKQGWSPYTPTFYEHLMKIQKRKNINQKLKDLGIF